MKYFSYHYFFSSRGLVSRAPVHFPVSRTDKRRGLPLHRQKRGGALCEQESAAESDMWVAPLYKKTWVVKVLKCLIEN